MVAEERHADAGAGDERGVAHLLCEQLETAIEEQGTMLKLHVGAGWCVSWCFGIGGLESLVLEAEYVICCWMPCNTARLMGVDMVVHPVLGSVRRRATEWACWDREVVRARLLASVGSVTV